MKRESMRDLLDTRSRTVAEMRTILDSPKGIDGNLDADQEQRWQTLKSTHSALDSKIERQAFIDDAERRMQGTQITGSGDGRLDDELRSFSLVKAIASQVPDLAGKVDFGREVELSRELERRSGRKASGIMVPMQAFERRADPITTTLPAAGPGSNLVATDYRGDLYIDALRNALTIRRLGARIITGLVGNVDIPRLKASATSGWVAENAALTGSAMQFEKASLTPKHCGAMVEFSRNMLLQASPDIEQLVRDDFAKILAEAVDSVAIQGGSANEPDGILATTGIGDVPLGTNGGPITADAIIDLVNAVEIDNAVGTAFLTNFKVKKTASKLKDGEGLYLGLDTVFQGYSRGFSNLVPSTLDKGTSTDVCSAILFGDWSDLILGYWSELDILVNPYSETAYSKGNVLVRGMLTMDMAVRHPESFAAIKDITTA